MTQTFCQVLLKNEKEVPNRVYLRQPKNGHWHEYTWGQTVHQARQVAQFLLQLGLKKGSHVSIISKNCAEWFIADFGIIQLLRYRLSELSLRQSSLPHRCRLRSGQASCVLQLRGSDRE